MRVLPSVAAAAVTLLHAAFPLAYAGAVAEGEAGRETGAFPRSTYAELVADPLAVVRSPDPADPATCAARRRRAAEALGTGALIVSAGPSPEDARFLANDDFYWLTGLEAPEAVLLLVAADGELVSEVLYLPAHDERHELWNGPRLTPGEAAEAASGVRATRSLDGLEDDLAARTRDLGRVLADGERVASLASPDAPRVNRLLRDLQQVKDAGEIAATRRAVDITQAALRDAMRVAVPGAWEFTAEAAIEGGFRSRGAATVAFPSICGSGPNTCYLHYRDNERRLEEGDLLLMDVGAKYQHYSADVTRTIPVSGRFTPRQREVYDAVHEASRKAAAVLRPGATLADADEVARDVLATHGFSRKDFPHSIGHGLGLRVHDAPGRRTPLEPGMVVTIEPGIYLPDEAIGIRIEDDYLITEDGAELLSDDLPADGDALEAFLAELRDER